MADEQTMVTKTSEAPVEPKMEKDPRFEEVTRALEVLQQASVEPEREKRMAVARQALDVSKECIEAWLLLANEAAGDLDATKEYLNEAVAAGDRLFASRRETWRGKFWTVPQTRSYMQARTGLGQLLWDTGERERAVEVLTETLALNPADHQGVRFVLLKALFELERYEDAYAVVEQYPDEQSTPMLYAKLLSAYTVHGDSLLARSAFIAARKQNPHVLDYLTGLRQLPQKLPRQAKAGDESEAIRYVAVYGDVWEQAPGAIAFVRTQKKLRMDKEARKQK
ncbi:MAG: hypothetical protein OWT28_04535 [Firmicutes bacterium]|nr:hypothetical protein [Bacillota bacterium]